MIGSVLGIWAHPDDESYLSAGYMMLVLGQGHRVVCITASRGEEGSTDAERWPPGDALAGLRTAESERAMAIFGVTEHHWLDYPDGGVGDADPTVAVDRILALADGFEPDVIVTFPPSGLTGHRDHQAVSRWSTEVHARMGGRPVLLHAADLQSKLDLFADRWDELGVYVDGGAPVGTPDHEAMVLALTDDELDRKWQGLVAQRSQTEILFARAGHDLMRQFIATEAFVPAS